MERSPLAHDRVFSDEAYAATYARRHRKMAEKFGREYAGKLRARGFQGGKILDVGCGSGAMNLVLTQTFADSEVVGIDLSDPLLALANQEAGAASLAGRLKFEKADVHQIPYQDDAFDVVMNVNMVHLVEDPVTMLDEMERVLAPGGYLFVADLKRSWLAFLESEMKSCLTQKEAWELISRSKLRRGSLTGTILWWRFETV